MSLKVTVEHAVSLVVCLETKAKFDEVLNQPGFTGTMADIIKNNGTELTPEQLAKALDEGVLCQSDQLSPYTEYIYGFLAVNEEKVALAETYNFRTEAAPVVDLRMQLVGEYEAAITDLDGQPHTFRVTVSDGPNDVLKTEYALKNQLAILGFDPCGVSYRTPRELLDNGWASTEEEANANYGPKIILEVKQDNTVATGALNPNTSDLEFLMGKFNGRILHFQGYCKTGSGRIFSVPTSFPVEVSEDCNTLTVQPFVENNDTYYPGVYEGDSAWYGGTELFRGGSGLVLTRVAADKTANGAVRCSVSGRLTLPDYVSFDLSRRCSDQERRTQMLDSFSAYR